MDNNEGSSSLPRKLFPRIIKASLKGLLWFVFLYALPSILISQLTEFAPSIASSYTQRLIPFAATILFFVVASELTSKTIFQHAFNVGKMLALMVFIIYVLEGGLLTIEFQMLHIVADLRVYMFMVLAVDFLGLAKSLLQAVNFLHEKAESQLPPLEPRS